MSEEIRPGRYRHFKGKEYEVLGVARHSETEEEYVVYRQLYGEHSLWVRPASMWNEMVTRDGKTQRRFTYVGEEAWCADKEIVKSLYRTKTEKTLEKSRGFCAKPVHSGWKRARKTAAFLLSPTRKRSSGNVAAIHGKVILNLQHFSFLL